MVTNGAETIVDFDGFHLTWDRDLVLVFSSDVYGRIVEGRPVVVIPIILTAVTAPS